MRVFDSDFIHEQVRSKGYIPPSSAVISHGGPFNGD